MYKGFCVVFVFLLSTMCFGFSTQRVDSLQKVIGYEGIHDTTKIALYFQLSDEIKDVYPDSMKWYTEKAIKLIRDGVNESFQLRSKYIHLYVEGLNQLGTHSYTIGEYDKAYSYFQKALRLTEQVDIDKDLKIGLMINMGAISYTRGDIFNATTKYLEALRVCKQSKDTLKMIVLYSNVGMLSMQKEQFDEALEYFGLANELNEIVEDVHYEAMIANNVGSAWFEKGYVDKAEKYFNKALRGFVKENNVSDKASVLNSLSKVYMQQGRFFEAERVLDLSIKCAARFGNKKAMMKVWLNRSKLFYELNRLDSALAYSLKVYEMSKVTGSLTVQEQSASLLANIYSRQKKWKNAYLMSDSSIVLKDKLGGIELQKKLMNQEAIFKYEAEISQNERSYQKQMLVKEKEKEKQEFVSLSLLVGVIVGGVFVYVLISRLKVNNLQKKQIKGQKQILEDRNNEITSSIQYAKRIQSVILPSKELLDKLFASYFVFYRPKDIVSGDFYWVRNLDGLVMVAVADCTGHGVPGALVSMLSYSFLNQSVDEMGLRDPGEILDYTRKLMIYELNKDENEMNDGMDIALCVVSKDSLKYSGAFNSLYKVSNGDLEVFHADKQPVGRYVKETSFTTHEVPLEKGNRFYLFSDGYADQFGGEKGKKIKTKRFKEFILETSVLSIDEQSEKVRTFYDGWKGAEQQVDDVCVLGFEV